VAAFPPGDDIIRSAIPLWKRLHPNTDIRVLSRSFEDHHTVLLTALSTASNVPDVMMVEVGYLGRFAEGSRLVDLVQPPFLIREQQIRFAPFAFQQATARSGAVVAAPADLGPGTLLYRPDLLKAAGVTPAELTQSWESYLAAGVKIKKVTGARLLSHAVDLAEVMTRANIAPGEGLYFDAAGGVLVETPRFAHAFEIARRVRDLDLDANHHSWSSGWIGSLKDGSVATLMSGAWVVGHLSSWVAPQTKGQWRATQLPDNTWGTWGGSFYAIPKASKNKQMAWEFVQFMTLRRETQITAFKSHGAFPALLETYNDPFFEQPIEFLGGQRARLLWREATAHISRAIVHDRDMEARAVVLSELNKVLYQGKDIRTALHDARLTIERLARNLALQP
jgi:multiple sugar transport system substrate-binding protein